MEDEFIRQSKTNVGFDYRSVIFIALLSLLFVAEISYDFIYAGFEKLSLRRKNETSI